MRKKQILICDDTDDQFELLRGTCERNGHEVHRSRDWKEVIEDLRQHAVIQLLILVFAYSLCRNPGVFSL